MGNRPHLSVWTAAVTTEHYSYYGLRNVDIQRFRLKCQSASQQVQPQRNAYDEMRLKQVVVLLAANLPM
jgi:hypothetical protein